jgi:hypothetical protein
VKLAKWAIEPEGYYRLNILLQKGFLLSWYDELAADM